MINNPLIFAATCDVSGKTRGKAFPVADLEKRLRRGVGWTPTNVQITCFDTIAESPFGSLGDLLLIPDPEAAVDIDFGGGTLPERFMLGDIVTLEGEPWSCCTRSILKAALARLERAAGLTLVSAFEHEFQLKGGAALPGEAFSLAAFNAHRGLGETLMAALEKAGIEPDTFLKEYGPNQFEVTNGPDQGVRAADAAVILRELTRSVAKRFGCEATLTPIRDPADVGNGVHIHMSFLDQTGAPATYDEAGPYGMSRHTGAFVAGVLKYLDSIVAITAPSDISYLRLTPHRWSAAYNNLGFRDREASVRICPVTSRDPEKIARQYNFEYRAADAAASPYLALAAIVHAGAQGIEDKLAPPEVSQEDLSLLSAEALQAKGYQRLPTTLPEALDRFRSNPVVCGWFPEGFADVYLAHKTAELACVANLTDALKCAAYEAVY